MADAGIVIEKGQGIRLTASGDLHGHFGGEDLSGDISGGGFFPLGGTGEFFFSSGGKEDDAIAIGFRLLVIGTVNIGGEGARGEIFDGRGRLLGPLGLLLRAMFQGTFRSIFRAILRCTRRGGIVSFLNIRDGHGPVGELFEFGSFIAMDLGFAFFPAFIDSGLFSFFYGVIGHWGGLSGCENFRDFVIWSWARIAGAA